MSLSFKITDRDIKGANILVDPTGEIKLADFGMAKHVSGLLVMLITKVVAESAP